MSGEHGDGLAPASGTQLFGPEVYAAFEAVKHAFDPDDRMNPGKVVASPTPAPSLRLGPETVTHEPEETVLDFSSQGGFARAEMLGRRAPAARPTAGRCAPATWSPATRSTPRAGECAASAW